MLHAVTIASGLALAAFGAITFVGALQDPRRRRVAEEVGVVAEAVADAAGIGSAVTQVQRNRLVRLTRVRRPICYPRRLPRHSRSVLRR